MLEIEKAVEVLYEVLGLRAEVRRLEDKIEAALSHCRMARKEFKGASDVGQSRLSSWIALIEEALRGEEEENPDGKSHTEGFEGVDRAVLDGLARRTAERYRAEAEGRHPNGPEGGRR